jgi:hypothetical protein
MDDPSNTIMAAGTFTPARFPTGTGYRGPDKTLYARRAMRDDCDPYGCDDLYSFRIRANATVRS